MANNYDVNINGFDNTKRAFKSFQSNIASSSKQMAAMTMKMAKAGAAMGAAVGAAGIALTKASMDSLDALAKTADKIGVTTEALAGLQHAGELTGVSTNTMNMALQRMTRRVSEAANGTGEAVKALDELGINAVELEKLPLDVQMGVIAEKMGEVGSQSDRVRLAMKLFDSEGVALVNTLALGSDGLEEMAAEAEQLGLSMSRVETAQIEAANDAVSRAGGVFKGLGNQFAVSFSPLIETAADAFRQSALDSAEFGNVGQKVADKLVKGFAGFRDLLDQIILKSAKMSRELYGAMQAALEFIQATGPIIDNSILGAFFDVPSSTLVIGSLGKVRENIKHLDGEIDKLSKKEPPGKGILEAYEKIVVASRKAAEEVAKNSPGLLPQVPTLVGDGEKVKLLPDFSSEIDLFRETTSLINFEIDNIRSSISELSEMELSPDNIIQFMSSIRDQSEMMSNTQKSLSEFEKKTQKEKTEFAVQQGKKTVAELAKVNKVAFMANKARMIAEAIMNTQAAATKALVEFPPPFSYIAAAATVASGMANVAQIRSQSFEGGGFTGVGARAGGLDGKGGFMAMVHPNETVVDHTKQKGGQANPVNVSFNINANDTRGFDELLSRRRGQIISMINEAMNDRGRPALI